MNHIRGDDVRVACPLFQAGRGGSIPTSPLDLTVVKIDMPLAQRLNSLWHSVLPVTHLGNLLGKPRSVAYAAEYDGWYYATAIWTSPIAANRMAYGWQCLELRRLAIAPDAPRMTASRMLAVMTRLLLRQWPDLWKLVSYQSVDHHEGTIYKAAGWKEAAHSISKVWHPGEHRAVRQILSDKVRWEKVVGPEPLAETDASTRMACASLSQPSLFPDPDDCQTTCTKKNFSKI